MRSSEGQATKATESAQRIRPAAEAVNAISEPKTPAFQRLRAQELSRIGESVGVLVLAVLAGPVLGLVLAILLNERGDIAIMALVAASTATTLLLAFTFGIKRTVIRWHCGNTQCNRILETTPWACGYCDNFMIFRSVLSRCDNCKTAPQSYRCPHCNELTHFTFNCDGKNPARRYKNQSVPVKSDQEMAVERERQVAAELHQKIDS
jgi:hypothetical protein